MSTTVRYAIVALLTFAATFGYFKFTQKIPVAPPAEVKIKTYPITQYFKLYAQSLVDSVALQGQLKDNLNLFFQLDALNDELVGGYNEGLLAFKSDPCTDADPSTPCTLSYIEPFMIKGCVACRCCNDFFNQFPAIRVPRFPRIPGPGPIGPRFFKIAVFENMNLRLFFKGKELNFVSNSIGKTQIKVLDIPENTSIDRLSIEVGGKVIEVGGNQIGK
jgi:hypothetical protein